MPYRRYNSRSYSYSLAVRLLVLLLLIHTFASACTADSATEEEAGMPEAPDNALAADTSSVRRSAYVSLLGNPFIGNYSQVNNLNSYFDRINADFTLDADPIENRHQPSVTDTIYTIRSGNSVMEFYAPTKSGILLLQMADITSGDIKLRDNLRVGMSQGELMNSLKAHGQDLKITQSPSEVIAANREGAPTLLRFFLKNGKVHRILFEGYVD
ncbi:hypothetical protein CLV24_10652 [Pontibacter ummariensis]|uniref:Beta-lactamase-inhibitor-like, PepSY-like n=1 Tax=Pontibacter ummariensis TaxID=1610492 RepID=A0A239EAP5_9BACT|nr:hypothetical protein [Pontibacter ummariensis]PRY13138.1 hypothetical protein CLV24_10652 [Pontibacter ummariensis]SNS40982.1 hypothetical protein SAMN06296052_10652 [Pontibacter ummariensis]